MRVLVVEDDEYMARVYERVFRLAGHDVTISLDGEDALAILAHMELPPEAIVLDLKLPKISGEDVLKSIKNDARFKHIPVAILTNSIHREEKEKYLALGANVYMVKIDHTPNEVLAEIEKYLTGGATQEQKA